MPLSSFLFLNTVKYKCHKQSVYNFACKIIRLPFVLSLSLFSEIWHRYCWSLGHTFFVDIWHGIWKWWLLWKLALYWVGPTLGTGLLGVIVEYIITGYWWFKVNHQWYFASNIYLRARTLFVSCAPEVPAVFQNDKLEAGFRAMINIYTLYLAGSCRRS